MRSPEAVQFEPPKETSRLSNAEVAELPPDQLVAYLSELEEAGQLEDFLESAIKDESLKAQISYWEKWLSESQQEMFDTLIESKSEAYGEKSESLPLELEKKFSADELKLIFSNVKAIQLTFGCSKGCPFCGFDAIKGAREHIPYSQLRNMFEEYGDELSEGQPFLYWASEPSDYASKEGLEDRTYEDVHELAARHAGYDPSITSFNLTDEKWLEFMSKSGSTGNRRLSMFGLREKGVDALIERRAQAEVTDGASLEFFGEDMKHVKGMGLTAAERESTEDESTKDIPKAGIACIDGVLLTPRGLYNTVVVPISQEYPQGTIMIPIEKISSDDVQAGESLQYVMRRSVIEGRYSHAGAMHIKPDKQQGNFQEYTGKFPKTVFVNTADKKFYTSIDQDGTILESVEYNKNQINAALERAIDDPNGIMEPTTSDIQRKDMKAWAANIDLAKQNPTYDPKTETFSWRFWSRKKPGYAFMDVRLAYDQKTDAISGNIGRW